MTKLTKEHLWCTTQMKNSEESFDWNGFESRTPDEIQYHIMEGSSNTSKFKRFQIRWAERLGFIDNPYLIRWTFIIFGYSIRIHHWIKSDDRRFFHDHSSNLLSIVLKGKYDNVVPIKPNEPPVNNSVRHHVEGIFNSVGHFFHMNKSIWFSKAEQQHYLDIPKGGAWTLMFEGKPRHKWGFYVNGHKWRPLRYFHKYGIIQDSNYQ